MDTMLLQLSSCLVNWTWRTHMRLFAMCVCYWGAENTDILVRSSITQGGVAYPQKSSTHATLDTRIPSHTRCFGTHRNKAPKMAIKKVAGRNSNPSHALPVSTRLARHNLVPMQKMSNHKKGGRQDNDPTAVRHRRGARCICRC